MLQKISFALALCPILIYAVLYQHLPEEVPSNFALDGTVNSYLSPEEFSLIAFLPLALWGLFLVLPSIDPKKENYAKFQDLYQKFHFGMVVFLDLIFLLTLMTVFSQDGTFISKLIPISTGLLLLLIGNYLPQIKPNFFMGIRTPWTLSNDTVWIKTHRIGGIAFILLGIILILSPYLTTFAPVLTGIGILIALLPLPFSYYYYKQEEKKQPPSQEE